MNRYNNQFRLGVIVADALLSLQKTMVADASLSRRLTMRPDFELRDVAFLD